MKKLCYFLAVFLVLIDQVVKLLVTSNMKVYESIPIFKNFFNITYARNNGAAFSILQNKTYLLLILAFLVIGFIMWYINKQEHLKKIEAISLGLLLGGVIGNFIDRLLFGIVIDYLDFKIFGYDYPIFNLADSFIVIGVFIMCYIIIRSDIRDSRRKRSKCKN